MRRTLLGFSMLVLVPSTQLGCGDTVPSEGGPPPSAPREHRFVGSGGGMAVSPSYRLQLRIGGTAADRADGADVRGTVGPGASRR